MKSSLRICVVISTVLVLGTSHPQNYQHPGYYRDQRWNQHQPQDHPVHQWQNYQQAAGPEAANNQNFQKHPIQPNSQSPAVVVNVNEVTQEVVHANHTHKVRKISVPLSELDKYKGARIIHLKGTGNKDFKILRVVGHNETVYEEKDIPDSLKDIMAKALEALEAETIHSDPVNSQSVNVQNENIAYRPVGSPRPRNRFGSASNERPVSGYPFHRRRPFQMNHNDSSPVQGIRRPAQVLDNVKVATADNLEPAEKLDNIMPEKIVAIKDAVDLKANDKKPEVKSEPTDKQTKKVTEQDQQKLEKTLSDNVFQSRISDETKSDETLPTSDEDGSYIAPSTTVTGPERVSIETSNDDEIIESESEVLSNLYDDDDFSFVSKHGRTLLTTTDDNDSEIVPSIVTEPLIPTNSNDDDNLLTATELRALLNNDDIFSKGSSTTATELTNEPIIDTIDNNKAFIDNETGMSDTANDNSNTISSISKTEPTAATFTKPSEASMKPLAKIVVLNQALDSSNSLEVKSPYVFISPYQKDGSATLESSTFFTKLIGHLIGKKPMNVAKIEEKNKTEFEETDDKYLENYEGESETFKKDRMASKSDTKLAKPLKERENKIVDDETNTTNYSEEKKKKIALTSHDASTDEKDTLTPISFVTSLTRNALRGGDSLKDFFNEQRVKDFLLRLM